MRLLSRDKKTEANAEQRLKEPDQLERALYRVHGYQEFMGETEEELFEEDLDLVSAAGTGTQDAYREFLRRMEEKK